MRAGDTVKHGPSGEEWQVSYADDGTGYMSWIGWPEGKAAIAHCEVTRECRDDEHVAVLVAWATKGGDDHRTRVCERQLRELEESKGIAFFLRPVGWLRDKIEAYHKMSDDCRKDIDRITRQIKSIDHDRHLMSVALYRAIMNENSH